MSIQPCRLCFKYTSDYIDIFSDPCKKNLIQSKIYKLFLFRIKVDDSMKFICNSCVSLVRDFYKFYKRVKQTQISLFQSKLLCKNDSPLTSSSEQPQSVLENNDNCAKTKICRQNDDTLILYKSQIHPDAVSGKQKQGCQSNFHKTEIEYCEIKNERELKQEKDTSYDMKNIEELNHFDSFHNDENLFNYGNNEKKSQDQYSTSNLVEDNNLVEIESTETALKKSTKHKTINELNFPTVLIRDGKLVTKGSRLDNLINKFFNIQCEMCPGIPRYKKLTKLMNHYKMDHGIDGYLRCCDTRLFRHRAIYLHMARHLQPSAFECPICKKTVTRPHSLKIHMQTHLPEADKSYKCDQCDRRFGYLQGLHLHKQSHHVPIEERKTYECEECGKVFTLYSSFNAHMKSTHSGAEYLCTDCGRCFKRKAEYKVHALTHDTTGQHQKQCQHCGFICKNRITLKMHLKRHIPGPILQCNDCPYKSQRKCLLQRHIQVTHSDSKPFQCVVCETKFKTKTHFKSHMRKHTDSKIRCLYCDKSFMSHGGFLKHCRIIHREEYNSKHQERYKNIEDAEPHCMEESHIHQLAKEYLKKIEDKKIDKNNCS